MSVTYGRSTYKQLIDDILLDTNESMPLADVGPEIYVSWILRAEEELCKHLEVREEYILRALNLIDEYSVQDRPAISNITNSTVRTVTAAGHGVADNSRVLLAGVSGIDGINQQWFTYGSTTDTFVLAPGAYIKGLVGAGSGLVKVTTEIVHGFTDGATITLYGTPIDAHYTITLVDTTSFTIVASDASLTLSTGAQAIWKDQLVGSGDYVSGGRFWKDSEVPTFFQSIRVGYRTFGGLPKLLNPISFEDVRLNQERDGYGIHTAYSAPDSMTFARKNGVKYLKLWPIPRSNSDIVFSGRMMLQSQLFRGDSEDATIHLSTEYDELIKAYVASKIYKRLKDDEHSDREYLRFKGLIEEHRLLNRNPVYRQMTYYN